MKVIITTSGTGSRLDKITKYTNKALVKIGDKFAIDYIIDNYKHIEDVEFIITVGYYANFVKQYINIAYKNKIKYQFVEIDNYDKPGSSLLYSLSKTKEFVQCPFVFHCCDAIIRPDTVEKWLNPNKNQNILFVNNYKDSSQYATIIANPHQNDIIMQMNEKGAKLYDYIYIGVACIHDFAFFWKIVDELLSIMPDNSSLSDIHIYKKMLKSDIKLFYKEINNYNDIGNIVSYENANVTIKRKYNVIDKLTESISFLDNMVVKWFYDKTKTQKYIERVKYICCNIPNIYDYSDNFISMELINSPPLSEIYEYGKVYELLSWANSNLWLRTETTINFKEICRQFYYEKTMNRVQQYLHFKPNQDFNIINGINVGSIYDVLQNIDYNWLCDSTPTKFHGDFVLDNILYPNEAQNIKFILIDWREDFGGQVDFGDKYYDLAKLKHNIFFNHNNIVNRLYDFISKSSNSCIVDMKCNYMLIKQLDDFDKFVREQKLDGKKIDVIQGLIWINMAALYEPPLSNMLFHIGKLQVFLSNS
jgi:choline kinase